MLHEAVVELVVAQGRRVSQVVYEDVGRLSSLGRQTTQEQVDVNLSSARSWSKTRAR